MTVYTDGQLHIDLNTNHRTGAIFDDDPLPELSIDGLIAIGDIDTSQTSDFSSTYLPSGWTTPSGGGARLTTTYEIDELGRVVKTADPAGSITYTVYKDAGSEVRTYSGWNDTTNLPTGPIRVSRTDSSGDYAESLTFAWTGTGGLPVDGGGAPTGAESLTSTDAVIQSLSRSLINDAGQATRSRQYFSLAGLTYSQTTADLGTEGTHYLETEFVFDRRGRTAVTVDPAGTDSHTFYDSKGRVTATWIGTDDVPDEDYIAVDVAASNLVVAYKLNETTGATADDSSTNGNDATVTGATWDTSGIIGGALAFDGTDDSLAATGLDTSTIALSTTAGDKTTVAFWMYWNGGVGEMPFSFSSNYNLYFGGTTGSETFGFRSDTADLLYTDASDLADGWHHVTAVFHNYDTNESLSANELTLYLDGVQQTLTAAGTPATGRKATGSVRFGEAAFGANGSDFDGKLDDPRIFNRQLTDTEINNLAAGLDLRDFRYWLSQNPTATEGPAGTSMVKISAAEYDGGNDGGNGLLTTSTTYFGSGANDYYQTEYQYDWRNRRTDVLSPADVVTHSVLDNLGRSLYTKTYASSDFTLTAGELRAQSQNLHDPRGRVYESRTYEVNQSTGAVGDYLPSTTWYDNRGMAVKTENANGLFQKRAYDGAGRSVASYTGYDADETAYVDADDVSGDTVIEQSRTWYDEGGQAVASATYRRLPADTTTTGELTAANSYTTAAVNWYDALGRTVATADYGREDIDSGVTHSFFNGTTGALIDTNTDGIPDVAQSTAPEPYTASTTSSMAGIDFQLRLTEYDSAGRAYRTTDNLGRINETQYDAAGRTVRTIKNYQNGTVEETDTDQDSTVAYEYDSAGRMVTLTAYNPKGSGNGVEQQATKYLYESDINGSWQTAAVYPDTGDTLSQDSTTKQWTITTDNGDHVSTQFDRMGRTTGTTDQRGVVHAYTFDSAGRLSADTVTSLGSSGIVDGTVRRIDTAYDSIGRVQAVTSYGDTSGTQVVNEVEYAYDGWGNLAEEWQAHDGAVDTATTPSVQYTYDDGATGGIAKYVRLAEVTYPNGRDIEYDYGTTGAIDDIMSRLATIGDGTDTFAAYDYLGANRIVTEDYAEAEVKLDHAANDFAALDRFGRVLDQVWTDYGANPDVELDHFGYTYDRMGNRTERDNDLHTSFNEDYTYDNLDRLTDTDRADAFDQSWTLDGLGNFAAFDNDGTTQDQTANAANELTAVNGWTSPAHDATGNMTTIPTPTGALGAKYDGWNQLIEVTDGGVLIAKFSYDGTGRRIEQLTDFVSGTPQTATHYFHKDQQVIETREGSPTSAPESLNPKYQNIWSPRYIDSLILRDEYSSGTLQTDSRLYYLADANYNVTALVGKVAGNWQTVERYVYTPYGKVTVLDPDFTTDADDTSDFANTTLYTGRELDAATGLYYYRARYYSADLGRFVSRDPIGFRAGDANLYRYVGNTPTNATDPTGLDEDIRKWVDGYQVRYQVAKGEPSLIAYLFGPPDYPGPWGQLATATSGSINTTSGVETTVNMTGNGVCNTIIPDDSGTNSLSSGEINVSVFVSPGLYIVLWNWDVSASGNVKSGVASVIAPSGTVNNGTKPLPEAVLNPGFHDGGAERTIINVPGNCWTAFVIVDIAEYVPTLARSPGAATVNGLPASSSATGRIAILQIEKIGD